MSGIKSFKIIRTYHPEEATCGHLYDDKKKEIICTLEPPNRNNAKDDPDTAINEAGCISEGTYHVKRRDPKIYEDARFKDNWEILNVPNKSGVVFHSGAYWTDSKSCILTATTVIDMNPKNDVKFDKNKRWLAAQGKDALKKFSQIMPSEFELIITSDETEKLCNA